jgi:hypothetical protein
MHKTKIGDIIEHRDRLLALKSRVLQSRCIITPLKTIPNGMYEHFTMGGKIPILSWYIDSRTVWGVHNTIHRYKEVFTMLNKRTFTYYGKEIFAFYDALQEYSIKDKTGLIWGLAGCNCDAIAVWNGAAKVYVVDYNKPVCEHEKIVVMSFAELAQSGLKVDFAFSYSSFEHDGLGRYGDPINPVGDLLAMQTARKYMKDEGILFLGVPVGRDCLVWNAHRIYGELRLPLLLKGWQCIDIFDVYNSVTPNYPFDAELGDYERQFILVCRKINADFPSVEELGAKRSVMPIGETHRPEILARINGAILKYLHRIS